MSERIDDIVMYKMYTHAFKKRIPIMATIEILMSAILDVYIAI